MELRAIGAGLDGAVYLEPCGRIVRKVYHTTNADVAQQTARQEFERLTALSQVLTAVRGLRCPRPVALDLVQGPTLRMEACKGINLAVHLSSSLPAAAVELELIARRLVAGITLYVERFGEPHPDPVLTNFLWDPVSEELTLLDLVDAPSKRTWITFDGVPPLERSVGQLIGFSLYHGCCRPACIRAPVLRRQTMGLLHALVTQFLRTAAASGTTLSQRSVFKAALVSYTWSTNRPYLPRLLWHRTVSPVFFTMGMASLRRTWRRTEAALKAPTPATAGGL